MARSEKVVVVGESRAAAEKFATDLAECGHDPEFLLATTESELQASVAAECRLLVACHPNPVLPALRVLQLLATLSAAPPVVVYAEGPFTEDEVGDLMRAGARDCLRRGDFRRIRKAYDRETSIEAARRFHGETAGDRYRALIEEIPALTYVAWADDLGSRAYVSPQLLTMIGYSPGEWLAEPDMWVRRLHPEDREGVLRKFRDACAMGGHFTSEYRVLDRNGRVVWWRDDGRVLPGPDGAARFVRGFVLDITEQKHAEESLRRLRYYDQVTGLPNRVWLLGRLGRDLARSAETGKPLSLLIVALHEDFRETSHTLGHHNADVIVREVASRLADAVGGAESVARLRGTEFGLLLPDANAEFARQLANRILDAFDRPFMVQRLPIEVSANVGIAVAPEHGSEAETLLRRADIAMHAARRIGGTVVEVYSPAIEPHDPSQLALLGELRHAIEGNQIQLYFQPKVGLKTRVVVGAEALLRWPHSKRGFVPPGEFVPLAENAGLNRALTRWVLEHAMTEACTWKNGGSRLEIAVNVSARSLQDRRIVDDVMSALERSGLEPARLIIEVTESAMMHDHERAAAILGDLRECGVAVSMDDFGTGFTSFDMLKRLDLTELKIDNSFVRGMGAEGEESSTDTAIVRATADLAHNLGITAVAEGVEDAWTLDLLSNFGCDQAQGYHIARPMPGPAFADWVKSSSWKTIES